MSGLSGKPAPAPSWASKLPTGVTLGPLSAAVFDVLSNYTAFPWPVLSAQCKRSGANPSALTMVELRKVLPDLAASVGRFTSPEKEQAVRKALELLTLRRDLM